MRKFFLIFAVLLMLASSACAEVKIGIIGAMDVEVNLLKEAAEISRITTRAGMNFCEGRIGSADVVIVKCGMGKVHAGICTQILADIFGVSYVINTGVAGGLNKDLKIGDVVVAVDSVQHDYDVTPIGFRKGEIPYTGKYAFESDSMLVDKAMQAVNKIAPEIKVVKGRICTGDQFIETKEQADAITSVFGGDCCDMESGAIAQACWSNNIPFVILRSICDIMNGETQADDYSKIEASAAELCASITKNMIINF